MSHSYNHNHHQLMVAKNTVPLHFRFPVAKDEKGGEFTHCEEFLDHLGNNEAGGHWPVGRNGLWHGAIHITHASAPWCALSSPSVAEQESHPAPFTGQQPLRNMADGEVVAYRVCSDLKEATWWGNPVPHACSFVLIRHYVQPGETPQSGLTFYTLYMNLAPWSAYTHDNAHNWLVDWPVGLRAFVDKHRAWQAGTLPRGTKITWDNTDPTLKSEDGGTVMGCVTLRQNVQTADMDLQAGDKIWVSVKDAVNLKSEFGGAKRPEWWETLLPPHQHTLELDKVVCPDPIPVKAGDAIGHLGYLGHLSNSRFSMKHEGQYQVHIECFTADDNLAHFLANPEQVGNDKPAWLRFIPGVTAYEYSGWPMKFEPRKEPSTLDAVKRLADEARSAKDGFTGQLYWCSGQKMDWIRDEDTKKLSRYDLAGQGFELVDIPTTGFKYLGENRSRKGFIQKLMDVLHFASKQEQRTKYGAMKYEYERHLRDIEAEREYDCHHILRWLYVPMLRHSLNRLIIKHTSAWAYVSHAMWEEEHLSDFRKHEPGEAEYWDSVLKNEVWMPGLDKSKVNLPTELWHMHPIMFLDAISASKATGWAHSPFADLIGNAESVNDYTAYNRTWPHPHPTHSQAYTHTNLTSMTIAQVMAAMERFDMFATGRFQITPPVMKEIVRGLNLDVNALYDEAMQDRMFEEYIIKVKRKSIINYLEGNDGVEDAAYACALEFASVGVKQGKEISPDPHEYERTSDGLIIKDKHGCPVHKKRHAKRDGVTYYSGDGLNKALIMPDSMIKALEVSKNESK